MRKSRAGRFEGVRERSNFTGDVVVLLLGDAEWKLVEPLTYDVGYRGSLNRISVPPGFKTDFASVPRILQPFLSPYGRWARAAVVHDFLYQTRWVQESYWSYRDPRRVADQLFLEMMNVLGVGRAHRYAAYRAVRWFGAARFKD